MESLRDLRILAWTVIISFVLIAGVVLIGWRVGWWFAAQNASNQYRVNVNSQQYQATAQANIDTWLGQLNHDNILVTQAQRQHAPDLVGQLKVENAALAGRLCSGIDSLTMPTAADAYWYNHNCSRGVVLPSSPYFLLGEGSTGLTNP